MSCSWATRVGDSPAKTGSRVHASRDPTPPPVQTDGREWCLQSIQTNGEVPPSSNFSCPPLLTFPTPPPKGIPIRLGRCPSHLGLTGKEVGTSGEKEDRIHGGKKTRGRGEWLSWNTGAGFIQVGEHRSNKAHPPSAQRVHLSN